METQQVTKKTDRTIPRLRGFDAKKPKDERIILTSQIREVESPKLSAIAIWNKIEIAEPPEMYEVASELFKKSDYSVHDVEDFCLQIKQFQSDENFSYKAGVIISAMINSGIDDGYKVDTTIFDKRLVLLGYKNIKHVTVIGDAGEEFASLMEDGSVTVKGSVHGKVGNKMSGGEIYINENVFGHVGPDMEGGMIRVFGNVGSLAHICVVHKGTPHQKILIGDTSMIVGGRMKGGTIHVDGFGGSLIGLFQEGGVITVGYGGSYVGPRRTGGVIIVREDLENTLGKPGSGGETFLGEIQLCPFVKNGEDETLKDLIDAWMLFRFDNFDIERSYDEALGMATAFKYSGRDLLRFSKAIECFQNDHMFSRKAGIFLSALVNGGENMFHTFDFTGLSKKVSMLGYKNDGIIRAFGDLGSHTGREMQNNGLVIVEGSAGYGTGAWKQGGSIIITGDSGDFLGLGMDGGYIDVFGKSGNHIGQSMKSGEIYLERGYGTIGSIYGGMIQAQDKILIKK
jgi:formylmethanofuran dehydrogenase subunit C